MQSFTQPKRRAQHTSWLASLCTFLCTLLCTLLCIAMPTLSAAADTTTPDVQASAAPVMAFTPSQLKARKAWSLNMARRATPSSGCYRATHPRNTWQTLSCTVAPNEPYLPRSGPRPFIIGSGTDLSAQAPSGAISSSTGDFENISGVSSVVDSGSGTTNRYSLQMNTDFMTSPACAASPNPGCRGWQQFILSNRPTGGFLFIQYWLIQYNTTCPAGWTSFSFPGGSDIYCYRNSASTSVPNQPIANMANWNLTGSVSAAGDSVQFSNGVTTYATTGLNAVGASGNWTISEFNIFGDCCGSQTNFNAGAQMTTRTQINYGGRNPPTCSATGTTGETNNLSFGPGVPAATGAGPAVIFTQSSAGSGPANCMSAVTVGDTHLRTFEGLLYDFQAAGDFTLAQTAPSFEVQTRQVSGAPTWPDATVNKAFAVRLGKNQVAVCLAKDPGTTRIAIDGQWSDIDAGAPRVLEGGSLLRRNQEIWLQDNDGNSVKATLHPTWIDVQVGLGRWPTKVTGLIANVKGNVNQIATRDGTVLTNPFDFTQLYTRFADSWRVQAGNSMLDICNDITPVTPGAPQRTFNASDLDPALRAEVMASCKQAGVRDKQLLEACALDVAFTGNPNAAKVFTQLPTPKAIGVIKMDDKRKR